MSTRRHHGYAALIALALMACGSDDETPEGAGGTAGSGAAAGSGGSAGSGATAGSGGSGGVTGGGGTGGTPSGDPFFTWDCEDAPAGELTNGTANQPFDDVNRYGGIVTEIADDIAHSGSQSIRLSYPSDEAGVELQVNDFGPSPTLFTRKFEYYAPGWETNWPVGLKTSRYFTEQKTGDYAYMSEKLIWLSYDSTCDEQYVDGMNNAIGDLDLVESYTANQLFGNGQPYIRTDHWYKYETWMVLDSALDAGDGVLRVWIDDVLVYSNDAVPWRATDRGRLHGDGWMHMWFGGNYSGAICGDPSQTVVRYIDDLYLSFTLDR